MGGYNRRYTSGCCVGRSYGCRYTKDVTMNNVDDLCQGSCKCSNKGTTELHPCPYQEDINNDPYFQCNCCADCIYECAMDI